MVGRCTPGRPDTRECRICGSNWRSTYAREAWSPAMCQTHAVYIQPNVSLRDDCAGRSAMIWLVNRTTLRSSGIVAMASLSDHKKPSGGGGGGEAKKGTHIWFLGCFSGRQQWTQKQRPCTQRDGKRVRFQQKFPFFAGAPWSLGTNCSVVVSNFSPPKEQATRSTARGCTNLVCVSER